MKCVCNSVKRMGLMAGLIMTVMTVGCTTTNRVVKAPTMTRPEEVIVYETPPSPEEGSVYVESSGFTDLFITAKAKRIGDIVTIKIVESSKASNKATTSTGRGSSLSGQLNSIFNFENKYTSDQASFNPFGAVKGGLDSEFEGNGATSRSGDLSAYISARIVDRLPNGNYMISGTREVQINNEKQYIVLKGIIRPRDISSENVILSTYISDAKIAYSGNGIIDDRQKPGWASNVLNKVWPF